MTDAKGWIFSVIALSQVPRILGLCDRNPQSPHQGCFDRLYWNYRITDFPSMWMQSGCLLLALLFTQRFAGNEFFDKYKVGEWARKSIEYWAKSLHTDGSGDEMYPYERSYCATAFSACAVAESLMLIDAPIPRIIEVTGTWLSRQPQPQATNQLAAACLAVHNIAVLLKDPILGRSAQRMAFSLLKSQTAEGIFVEYGGCDIGYLSITLGLLARLHQKTGEDHWMVAARRVIGFLEDKIHEDGTYDSRASSRKTQYLYPFGFAYFGSGILDRIIHGLKGNRILNPAWLDDRYTIPMTTDYLETYLYLSGRKGNTRC